jgi:hypothetical protein
MNPISRFGKLAAGIAWLIVGGLCVDGFSVVGLMGLTMASAGMVAGTTKGAQAAASICDAVAGNLVTNCGFEGGTYSSTIGGNTNNSVPNGWTPNAGFDLSQANNFVSNPLLNSGNSGSFALVIGNLDIQPPPAVSQTLTDVAGATYSGSIFVDYGGGGDGDDKAFFDVQINGGNVLALDDTSPARYTEYTFSFTGTSSDTLTLTGNTNPSSWVVDDVVVTGPLSAVPAPLIGHGLPVVLALGGTLFGAKLLERSRKRRSFGAAMPHAAG